MAILVSGGAGYIGSHTCVELLAAGYDIVVADNYYNSCPEALARVKQIAGKDFRFVEADMTEPASDDRNVDAGRDEVHGGGVPEGVWRYVLGTQRWHGFGRRLHVGGELEPDPGGAERLAIAVDEQPLVGRPWLPFKQFPQQHHGFWPERTDTFLPSLTGQTHATRAFEPDCFWAKVERFLYSCAAVVEEREQRMIPHALNGRTIWLSEDRRHFRRIQIARFRHRSSFDRDMEDFDAFETAPEFPGQVSPLK